MHPLISLEVGRLLMDDRLKAAEGARRAHEVAGGRLPRRAFRSALGRGLVSLGAKLTPAPEAEAWLADRRKCI